MYLSLLVVCVAIRTARVLGGCIEDVPHEHALDKETRELKDVEWIGKDLKFKLDHGINEKELLEKKLKESHSHPMAWHETVGGDLDKSHHLIGGKLEFLLKELHAMLGEGIKKEDISDSDLKSFMIFLDQLSSKTKDDVFLKTDPSSTHKDSFLKQDGEHALKTSVDHDMKKLPGVHSSEEDVKSYLAESLLHMAMNHDAEKSHHGTDDEMLHKKVEETKALKPDGSIPYFLMHDDAKAYYKDMSKSERMVDSEVHEKAPDADVWKKLMKLILDSAHFEEGSFLLKKLSEHQEGKKSIEEILKELAKKLNLEKGFGTGEEHDLKAFMEDSFHGLDKDRMYDEILKKEDHSLDKIYDSEKVKEDQVKLPNIDHHVSLAGEVDESKTIDSKIVKTDVTAKSVSIRAAELEKGKKSEESVKAAKDHDIDEILKEDGYYITGGTHAYEKARDQAHIDAKTPPLLDEASKTIDNPKLLAEEGKKIFHSIDEEHILDESMLDKDKAVHGTKFAFEEEAHKVLKNHGIDSELSKEEKKLVYSGWDESLKGKEAIALPDEYMFKTDESHVMHDKDLAYDHHAKGIDESSIKGNPHHKIHDMKNKFVSFLRKVLHMRKCHLVTMRPAELLSIVDCISRSKNPLLCEKFAMCEKKMPLQVILALEKCQKELIPEEMKRCNTYEALYPSREIPLKIFQCIVKNTVELVPAEKKQMIDFEECARQVKVESCGRIPWG